MKKNFAIKTYRKKTTTTAELLITDLLIIDKFQLIIYFQCSTSIALQFALAMKIRQMRFKFMYIALLVCHAALSA